MTGGKCHYFCTGVYVSRQYNHTFTIGLWWQFGPAALAHDTSHYHHNVSSDQYLDCLFQRLLRLTIRTKNAPNTQRARIAVSRSWRQHDIVRDTIKLYDGCTAIIQGLHGMASDAICVTIKTANRDHTRVFIHLYMYIYIYIYIYTYIYMKSYMNMNISVLYKTVPGHIL